MGTYSKRKESWSVSKWFFRKRIQKKPCPFIWAEQHGCGHLNNIFAADPELKSFHIVDINNKGQILGFGRRNGGREHIFILQPKNRLAKKDTKSLFLE